MTSLQSDDTMMKIDSSDTVLVTGGTGFTGAHLVRKLCATGATVRVIARQQSTRDELASLPVEWHIGDVCDEDVVKRAAAGVSYVFNVAAAFREAKVGDEVYWNVHVGSTMTLLKSIQCQRDEGHAFKRFVHVSTAGVHGHITEPPADENYRFATGDLYQQTKLEGEQLVNRFAQTHNFPMVIVRPCAIYGPGDRRLLKLFKLAKLPVCPVIGLTAKGMYHLIHVDDLTDFMILSATHAKTQGQTYIVGNPTATSIKEIAETIATRLGTSPVFVRIPAAPVFAAAYLCELLCKPFGIEPPIYRRRVAFFTKDRSFNTQKMTADTGFTCRHTNESGLTELADWYVQEGWL